MVSKRLFGMWLMCATSILACSVLADLDGLSTPTTPHDDGGAIAPPSPLADTGADDASDSDVPGRDAAGDDASGDASVPSPTLRGATTFAPQVSPAILSRPFGVEAGDYLLAVLNAGGNYGFSKPEGWTMLASQTMCSDNMAWFSKIAGSDDPASYSFKSGGASPSRASSSPSRMSIPRARSPTPRTRWLSAAFPFRLQA